MIFCSVPFLIAVTAQTLSQSLRRQSKMWQIIVLSTFFTQSIGDWVQIPQQTSTKSLFTLALPKANTPPTPTNITAATPIPEPMVTPLTTPTPVENPKNSSTTAKTEPQFTYTGFTPLLKNIQQTLINNAKKSLKSKLTLLHNLRDNLLSNIDQRMTKLWGRTKREEVSEARGHDDHEMEFPSNEGALMTIGFLTFAVFLIKLVLKLIYTLKNKNNNGMTTGAGTTMATVYIGRKKRQVNEEESLKILQLIEEYKFN